jgi:hypothetical protein
MVIIVFVIATTATHYSRSFLISPLTKMLLFLNYSVIGMLLILSCSCFADDVDSAIVLQSAVLSVGPHFVSTSKSQYGELTDVRKDERRMAKFNQYVDSSQPHVLTARHEHADGEGIDSIEKFFWGQDGGIVLELGM